MAANSSCGLSGFDTYASIPAARHCSRSPGHRVSGQRNDGDVAAGVALARADGGGGLEPAQFRHLHIHQNHVERLCGARLHGLTTVPDHDDLVAALPEQSEQRASDSWRCPPPRARGVSGPREASLGTRAAGAARAARRWDGEPRTSSRWRPASPTA